MTQHLSRTALILVATSALAACSTYAPFEGQAAPAQPNFPITAPPPPVSAPTAQAPQATAPEVRPAAPIESQALPTPAPSQPAALAETAPAPAYQPPAYQPPAYQPPPPPATRTETRLSVNGRVVDADGPAETYVVRKGDNLDAIARKMGTSREQLADDNKLKSPYRLRPGQTLKGPRRDAKAYVAVSGDTLFAIARRFSVTAAALAEANNISTRDPIRAGRKLILPKGYRDRGATRTTVTLPVEAPAYRETAPSRPERLAVPEETTPPPVTSRAPAEDRPERRSVTTLSVTGPVITVDAGPRTYRVRKGDNLDAIARDLGTTRKDLADDNKLKPPYRLRPGQVLKGPPRKAKAYVTESGDTLSAVSRRFSVSVSALAKANGLKTGAALRPGRRLILPEGFRDKGPIRTTTVTTPTAPPPTRTYPAPYSPPPYTPPTPSRPQPYSPPSTPLTRPVMPSAPIVPSTAPLSDAQISDLSRGRFQWPLRGEVISDFGPKATGQRNDGVNIRANAGEAVRAAASGDVVYAGDQVPGFGNLVLVKHADGWVTAYGHLARVDVKMQDRVSQGQQLGQAGSSGGASEPQLHFEVRYAPTPADRARPVDPKLVLPR